MSVKISGVVHNKRVTHKVELECRGSIIVRKRHLAFNFLSIPGMGNGGRIFSLQRLKVIRERRTLSLGYSHVPAIFGKY